MFHYPCMFLQKLLFKCFSDKNFGNSLLQSSMSLIYCYFPSFKMTPGFSLSSPDLDSDLESFLKFKNFFQPKRSSTQLHVACRLPSPSSFVSRVLADGVSPNLKNNRGQTPLHILVLGEDRLSLKLKGSSLPGGHWRVKSKRGKRVREERT